MRKKLALVLACLMCLSFIAACSGGGNAGQQSGGGSAPAATQAPAGGSTSSSSSQGGKTFVFARSEDIQNFDTFNQNNIVNNITNHLIYDFLVTNNFDGTFSPDLATEWSVSDDGLAWTFKLVEGVKFHNGEALTSDDVKTTFDRVIDDPSLIRANLFTAFKSIECPDDTTVIFHMHEPAGNMLMLLGSWPVCPGDLYREKGTDMFTHSIGSGPWKFVSWDPGQQIIFEKNTEYWKGEVSNCDTFIYKNVTEDTTRIAGLRTGDLDMVDSLPADQKALLEGEGFVVDSVLTTDQLYVGFRCVDSVFADYNARLALNHAIDRESIVSSILQAGRAANFPVGEGVMGYDASFSVPEYNVDLAKEYLAKTNYNGEPVSVIGPIGNYTRISEVLQAITSMLIDAGFNAQLEMIEGAAFQARRAAGEYDIYITGCSHGGGDPSAALTQRWVNDSLGSGYKNEQINELVLASNREGDPAKRMELMRQAMVLGVENMAPWTGLYQMDNNVAYKTGISGALLYSDKGYDLSGIQKAD